MKIKNLKFKIGNSSSGFTLVEMIVTVMVFSILVVSVTAIFIQAVRVERQAIVAQRVQENATFVLESIAKEIRASRISSPNSLCTATTLTMIHPIYGNITYSLNGEGNIQRQASSTSVINSSITQFTRFNFCIDGAGINDDKSTKVTMLISLKNRTGAGTLSVDLQTTVVSRDITTEFQYP